jgi:hypothetical protein
VNSPSNENSPSVGGSKGDELRSGACRPVVRRPRDHAEVTDFRRGGGEGSKDGDGRAEPAPVGGQFGLLLVHLVDRRLRGPDLAAVAHRLQRRAGARLPVVDVDGAVVGPGRPDDRCDHHARSLADVDVDVVPVRVAGLAVRGDEFP